MCYWWEADIYRRNAGNDCGMDSFKMDFIEKRKIKSLLKDCDYQLAGKLLINKFKARTIKAPAPRFEEDSLVLEIGLN
jgi:hypothetical protein